MNSWKRFNVKLFSNFSQIDIRTKQNSRDRLSVPFSAALNIIPLLLMFISLRRKKIRTNSAKNDKHKRRLFVLNCRRVTRSVSSGSVAISRNFGRKGVHVCEKMLAKNCDLSTAWIKCMRQLYNSEINSGRAV